MSKNFITASSVEFKLAANAADTGEFEGYGSVFGVKDFHNDTVTAGAFGASILSHKAAGSRPLMHFNHGLPFLGGVRSVGVWSDFSEDTKGLHMKGKLSGLNTDAGRMRLEQMKDGAFSGLSIGYEVPTGGAEVKGTGANRERKLNRLLLEEVSIVDDPSNAAARITEVKLALAIDEDVTTIAASIASAMRRVDKMLSGSSYDYGSNSQRDRALVMNDLRDAYFGLTGDRAPADLLDWKSGVLTPQALEKVLRDELHMTPIEAKAKVSAWFGLTEGSNNTDNNDLSDLQAALKLLP